MLAIAVLLACRIQDCVRVELPVPPLPYGQCTVAALPAAAAWIGEHPSYAVRRIVCELGPEAA